MAGEVVKFSNYVLPNLPFGCGYFGKDGWRGDSSSTDKWASTQEMPTMFTKENCTPASMGGKPISRHMMNKLGYLATIGSYLDRIGYPYGNVPLIDMNDPTKDDRSYGYPKGAIVSVFDEENKRLREYLSLVDNNTDLTPWARTFGGEKEIAVEDTDEFWASNQNWKPLYSLRQHSYFPDYSNQQELLNETVYDTLGQTVAVGDGWVNVTRTIPNFDSIPKSQMFANPNEMSVTVSMVDKDNPDDRTLDAPITTIMPYEGMTATRTLPIGAGSIRVSVTNSLGVEADDTTQTTGPITIVVSQLGFEEEDDA